MRRAATAILTAAGLLGLAAGEPARALDAIEVRAVPVAAFDPQQPDQSSFGPLRFVGGLQLDSPDRRLGGLSGIEISPDGRRVLMVSDVGDLIAATLDYRDGILTGVSDASVQRLLDEAGGPLGTKFGADAESLRAIGGAGLPDDVLVGLERDNRVLRYGFDAAGRISPATLVPMPDAVADLPYNEGLEGIAVLPPGAPGAGSIVAVAEGEDPARPGTMPGWVIAPDGAVSPIALVRDGAFNVTDAVALPNGDLIVLERRFNLLTGVAMRLRRIAVAELAAARAEGADPIRGEALFTAGMAYAVDNMEGLAAHVDDADRTILTIVSDDNFSTLQRTLLLQFELL